MHVGPKKTPRIPKPTPWWWKFTLGPTDEIHRKTTTRGLLPAIERNEATLEEESVNNIYQDVDEADGHIPIDDFSINEISNSDSNFLQPIPDSMLPPPAFIPSNELQPILQDNLPAISPKDMDPSNPPSADALPPPVPANTNTGKLLLPISVKMWLKDFHQNQRKKIIYVIQTPKNQISSGPFREFPHVPYKSPGPADPKNNQSDQNTRSQFVGPVGLVPEHITYQTPMPVGTRSNTVKPNHLSEKHGTINRNWKTETKLATANEKYFRNQHVDRPQRWNVDIKVPVEDSIQGPQRSLWRNQNDKSRALGWPLNIPVMIPKEPRQLENNERSLSSHLRSTKTLQTTDTKDMKLQPATFRHRVAEYNDVKMGRNVKPHNDVLSVFRIDTHLKRDPKIDTHSINNNQPWQSVDSQSDTISSLVQTPSPYLSQSAYKAKPQTDPEQEKEDAFITESLKERPNNDERSANVTHVAGKVDTWRPSLKLSVIA